ncbi:MAG TPA: helix-hairpin-helix domain-containing protein [Prosthecochloris aestuarii]|uniref:Helix-hairpin-helix domain-containing protein n=1 Tax=Prosthecochloris aestuarii TaxID=1102 RepID=A0A831SRY8_PROAE|nr:helix-hairpin-helix domain-containing protein [Prosthecochloris sp.]HED30737.1 helix-hairpin-helix domain-containing protein [Prosthecochloris aestuarii]
MKSLRQLALKLGITSTEMLVIGTLTAGLLGGILLNLNHGAVPAASLTAPEQEQMSDAEIDSLLREAALLDLYPGSAPARHEKTLHTAQPAKNSPKTQSQQRIVFSTATASELASMPGISSVLAERLIEFRKSRKGDVGRFEDFLEVKGIGKKRLEILQQHLTLE